MPDVLYVDDEPALLDLGKTYLERSGHLQVYTATSAREALEKMQHQDYAGIISDYQMPGMDGIEFLRLIRARHKNLPFILFTGRGREEVAIEALNSGADFYLQKGGEPTSQFVELEYKLKNAIERKRMQDELKESQQRMADIINFLPDAMFVIDHSNKVIAWNRTMEEITGIPKESILGTGDYSQAITCYGGKIPRIVDLVMNNDRTNESQAPNTERKGDKITSEFHSPAVYNGRGAHLWLVASPLYDTQGRVIGAIVALRDVTERKEAEEKLNRMNEDLHAAYEQLTATEEELRQNYDELSKSEQALRRSEERYRNVVEDQTEFICRFTPDGKLTFVNEAYCRYFGLDKTVCIGAKHSVVIPPEDLQLMKQHLSAFTPESPVSSIEHRIIMPSGEVRYQRWSDRAVFDANGRIVEFQSVGRDTTDRMVAEEKLRLVYEDLNAAYEQLTATEEELRQNYDELSKSEQALRRSEERYRNVVEDQTEFICRFTPDGKLTFVNEAYCRYFGLDKTACIGTKHTVVIPPEDLQLMKRHLSAFTPENTVGIIEHRIIMPSGEVRYQRWSDRAVFDTNGRIIEFQSVGRDTTDRMVAEEKLRLSHADLNTAYEQLTMNEEELRQNFDELSKSQQELRLSEERYRNVVEDQTEFICRFTPDGKLTFVNEAYCRYFGKSRKELVGALCPPEIPKEDMGIVKAHFSSITSAQPVATIEHRIRMPDGGIRWQQWSDRAVFDENGKAVEFQSVGRDITDRKRTDQALFEANKKLNLLSVITRHDILNQLTGLHGYLGLTEEIITDPDARNLIEKAMQASEVIKSQILFTRQYQDIGVRNPIWQNVYSSAMNVCQDGVFSHVSIDESLSCIEIFADPLLEMVFYNLFENAVMHGGTVTRIWVTGEAAPDGFNLIIEDDGRGILPEDKQKIFGKGFGSHTGLGLFLVKEVLAITSLVIRESGEYGRGAQFRIHIPDGMFRKTREREAR